MKYSLFSSFENVEIYSLFTKAWGNMCAWLKENLCNYYSVQGTEFNIAQKFFYISYARSNSYANLLTTPLLIIHSFTF